MSLKGDYPGLDTKSRTVIPSFRQAGVVAAATVLIVVVVTGGASNLEKMSLKSLQRSFGVRECVSIPSGRDSTVASGFSRNVRGVPEAIGGSPQRDGKNSDYYCRDGGYRAVPIVEEFCNMPSQYQHDIVRGAIFVLGLIGLIAYLTVLWYRAAL